MLTMNIIFLLISLFFGKICNSPIADKNKFESDLESWNEFDLQNPEELGNYFEGDLITPNFGKNGLVDTASRWNKGIIPYEISRNFQAKDKNIILQAISVYSKYTCISFRPKTPDDKDYISITNYNNGCWSKVGRQGEKQEVNLQSPQCTTKLGTSLHELMHAAGFLHEQNRNERDDFVTIKWDNIKDDRERNFDKAEEGSEQGFGVPYDFVSVMHYSSYAFSSNGKRTIITKDSKNLDKIGQRRGFSIGDIMKINAMYDCPEKTQQLNLTGDIIETLTNNNGNQKEQERNTLWEAVNKFFSIFDER